MKELTKIFKTVRQYGHDWPPEDANGALAWFQSKLADVPPEFRSGARIEINGETNDDDTIATIEISYSRPETDEEEDEREQRAAAFARRQHSQELKLLAELLAKHGKP